MDPIQWFELWGEGGRYMNVFGKGNAISVQLSKCSSYRGLELSGA